MRVVRVSQFGPPDVLRIDEADKPRPSRGQVVVAVELAGVAYGDTIVRRGDYPVPLPCVPGLEIGGQVVEVGPDVDQSLVGRRVLATTVNNAGGYAEHALAEVDNMYSVPGILPLEHAVAVFQAGAVAVGILAAMRMRPGYAVLVTAAAGRIGSLLIQLAKAAGAAPVIGAAGGTEKLAAASRFGADITVDYDQPEWVDQVKAATDGRGVDVVLDAIGGTIGRQAFDAAADGSGRLGVYGFTSGTWTTFDTQQLARRGLTVVGPLGIVLAKPRAERRADAEHALYAASTGSLAPRIHETYPLEQAAKAHAELEERRNIGAIMLKT